MNIDPSRYVITFKQAAEELGISVPTLRRVCKSGKGPPLIRLSERRLGIRRGDIDAWVKSREVK